MIPRRHERRGPRAHWVLLALAMLVVLTELCLNGYVTHAGSEGRGAPVGAPTGAAAPRLATTGGPVQHIGPGGAVTTRTIPARTIALTFDDGPDPQWTPQILDILARYHAHATFFEIGSQVDQYPGLSRRILAAGNEIGSHTFTHVEVARVPAWQLDLELALTADAIAGATGVEPRLLRPPYSSEPDALTGPEFTALRRAAAAGYLIVLDDRDTEDWRRPGVNAIVAAATPDRGAGAIVMMHDSGGNRAQTVAALNVLIPRLQARGYRFVTVSQALGLPTERSAGVGVRMRGDLLRTAQAVAAVLARVLIALMLAALVLATLRLVVQIVAARIHHRRQRDATSANLLYLGPVSVVVPAFNESANIAATVRSLVDSDYPRLEVIVVDDGSTDDTAAIVRRLRLRGVRLIRQENAGKPAALNTGIRAAHAGLIVLVDGDTVVQPEAIGWLVQPLADPAIGAASGNAKVANRGGLLGRWQHLEYVMGFNLDRRFFDVAGCMPTVPGAIGAFRREALLDAGGVSSQTLAEDTDLTMAVIRAGWRVTYAPDAIAWTEAPGTLRQLWRQRYRWCYGTMQAIWKHRRALTESGPAGRLGRRGLVYLLAFQIALPLCAPMVDLYAIYGILFLPWAKVASVWLGLLGAQMLAAGYALRLDRERLGPLWSLPLQQIVYRQLMYLVVVQSTVTALLGGRLRWHRLARIGAATARATTLAPKH